MLCHVQRYSSTTTEYNVCGEHWFPWLLQQFVRWLCVLIVSRLWRWELSVISSGFEGRPLRVSKLIQVDVRVVIHGIGGQGRTMIIDVALGHPPLKDSWHLQTSEVFRSRYRGLNIFRDCWRIVFVVFSHRRPQLLASPRRRNFRTRYFNKERPQRVYGMELNITALGCRYKNDTCHGWNSASNNSHTYPTICIVFVHYSRCDHCKTVLVVARITVGKRIIANICPRGRPTSSPKKRVRCAFAQLQNTAASSEGMLTPRRNYGKTPKIKNSPGTS